MRSLLALFVALPAFAQTPDFSNAKKWRGTISGTGTMTEADLPFPLAGSDIEFSATFSATIELERTADPTRWSGRILSSGFSATYSETLVSGDCTMAVSAHAGGLDVEEDATTLDFNGTRGFTVVLGTRGRTTTFSRETVCGGMMLPPETQDSRMYIPQSTRVIPFPPMSSETLSGSTSLQHDVSSSTILPGERTANWTINVHLSPVTSDVELIVENTTAYQNWRPLVAGNKSPGGWLRVGARLVASDGSKPNVSVETFSWELIGTSQEPGLSLNYPINASDMQFDLELYAYGDGVTLSNSNQAATRLVVDGVLSDSVWVVPFDCGGWSELRVSARLSDGRTLVGRLEGTPEEVVRIPKRQPGSRIADRWKETHGVSSPDDDDSETVPFGDGMSGDGLTLYEEYRGFFESGKHIEGSPKVKDLFIRNTVGGCGSDPDHAARTSRRSGASVRSMAS